MKLGFDIEEKAMFYVLYRLTIIRDKVGVYPEANFMSPICIQKRFVVSPNEIISTIAASAYFYKVLSLAGVLLETKEVKKFQATL